MDYNIITTDILAVAQEFGFIEANIAQIIIDDEIKYKYKKWLDNNYNGSMEYLERNLELRFNPNILHENTLSIICVKVPYLYNNIEYHKNRLNNPNHAYVSNYTLGRDYHKVVKQQLEKYATWINNYIKTFDNELKYRAFTDSAPVLEVQLAKKAQLGFIGKNTLLIDPKNGSNFFLGELFTNLPLITQEKTINATCGKCTKCLDICPTKAFVSPHVLDARRCISYLTIENKSSIPIELRKLIGNRIYGCDDCQLFCPWNKFSKKTTLPDFKERDHISTLSLIEAFNLTEKEWMKLAQGTSIYRIGYESWLRNVAVALGNAPRSQEVIDCLKSKITYPSSLVQEHIKWALEQHEL